MSFTSLLACLAFLLGVVPMLHRVMMPTRVVMPAGCRRSVRLAPRAA